MKVAIVSGVAAVYLACPRCGNEMADIETGSAMITEDVKEVSCLSCEYNASIPDNAFPVKGAARIGRLQNKKAGN